MKTHLIVSLAFFTCLLVLAGAVNLSMVSSQANGPDNAGRPAAQRGKPTPTPDLPVTTSIADYLDVTDNTGTHRMPMQFRSDGALYKNTADVQSLVQGSDIGDWVMQSDNSPNSTRTVFIDFGQPIAGSCPTCANRNPVVLPSKFYPTRFIAKCHEYNNNMFTVPYQVTINCPMYTRLDVNGQNYRINMNPVSTAQAYYPETNYVNISCTRAISLGQCNAWQVEPSSTYVPSGTTTAVKASVGKLVKVTTVKGKSVDVDQGDFYFGFSIVLTNP